MKTNKVKIQILNSKSEWEEEEGIISRIMSRFRMQKLYQIKTESGTYYRRETELKFI